MLPDFKHLEPLFYFSSFNNENRNDLNIDNNTLNKSAVKNPLTAKPVIKLPANKIIQAFMTNRNKPNVSMVTGNVKMTNNGRTNMFNKDIVNATKIAVP